MEVIYGLIPGMLLLGLLGVVVFFWAVRNGQYDDMEGAAQRMLLDDDIELTDNRDRNKSSLTETQNNTSREND